MWVHAEKAPNRICRCGLSYSESGNYRQDLFTVSGSAAAFERVIIDSCARFGWRL